jgi:hypothetical protein
MSDSGRRNLTCGQVRIGSPGLRPAGEGRSDIAKIRYFRAISNVINMALPSGGVGNGRLPAGRTATVLRFWLARDAYQGPSPVQLLVGSLVNQNHLVTPQLGYSFLTSTDAIIRRGSVLSPKRVT